MSIINYYMPCYTHHHNLMLINIHKYNPCMNTLFSLHLLSLRLLSLRLLSLHLLN